MVGMLAMAACSSEAPESDTGTGLSIAVRALSLTRVADASWRLRVTNAGGDVVWEKAGLTADRFGDGKADLAYVAPCDASGTGKNTVELVLEALYAGDDATSPIDEGTYRNPCGSGGDPSTDSDDVNWDGFGPCTQVVTCRENADVPVDFNLTILRDADQGFFDIAVDFADVFCSAKLDCVDELLHDPADQKRKTTLVMGFACTAGLGDDDTFLYLTDVTVTCASPARLDVIDMHVERPGNQGSRPPFFQVASYIGEEQLPDITKCYWNTAFGIDLEQLGSGCVLTATGTASPHRFTDPSDDRPDGSTPANTIWPLIEWSVPITDVRGDLLCRAHALDATGSGVTTDYTDFTGTTFAHELPCGGKVTTVGLIGCAHSVASLDGAEVAFRQSGNQVRLSVDGATAAKTWTLDEGLSLVDCCADSCCEQ